MKYDKLWLWFISMVDFSPLKSSPGFDLFSQFALCSCHGTPRSTEHQQQLRQLLGNRVWGSWGEEKVLLLLVLLADPEGTDNNLSVNPEGKRHTIRLFVNDFYLSDFGPCTFHHTLICIWGWFLLSPFIFFYLYSHPSLTIKEKNIND